MIRLLLLLSNNIRSYEVWLGVFYFGSTETHQSPDNVLELASERNLAFDTWKYNCLVMNLLIKNTMAVESG